MESPYLYRYTNAEIEMDIYGTLTMDYHAGISSRGYPMRLVAIPRAWYREQIERYATHFYTVMDEQEWKIDQHFGSESALTSLDYPLHKHDTAAS